MSKITKDTRLFDAIKTGKATRKVFAEYRLGCESCSGARHETVEWGARMHGLDLDEFLTKLNKAAKENGRGKRR